MTEVSSRDHLQPATMRRESTECPKCHQLVTSGVMCKLGLWHRHCFTCKSCHCPLHGLKFINKDSSPYCLPCFQMLFEKLCSSCQKPITGNGDVLQIYFDHRYWHTECFICSLCESSLIGELIVSHSSTILCEECANVSI